MRPLWTIDEIKDVLEIDSPLTGDVHGISIHSKEVKPGDLFIPLKGENHDAHAFVGEALAHGAIATLVDHFPSNLEMTPRLLHVPDTYQALITLARHARHRSKAHIIGITGSMGKTTTKSMLDLILQKQGITSSSVKSFNNHWGVPVSLCRLPQEATYGIFEVGMNHAGEIARLVEILKPTIALITEVAPVHIGNFKNFGELIAAKAEIFNEMSSAGIVILNRDSESYDQLVSLARKQGVTAILTFGHHPNATLSIQSIQVDQTSQTVTFTTPQDQHAFTLNAIGAHWAMNALGALTVAYAVCTDLEKACKSLKEFELLDGRGKQYALPHPAGGMILVIDESYNSNPTALRKALESLKALEPVNGGRRIAVLGDMYEVGVDSSQVHQSFAEDILQNEIDLVYTSGKEMIHLYNALPSEKKGFHQETVTPIAEKVLRDCLPGDIILVKGSRGGGAFPRMKEVIVTLMEGVQ